MKNSGSSRGHARRCNLTLSTLYIESRVTQACTCGARLVNRGSWVHNELEFTGDSILEVLRVSTGMHEGSNLVPLDQHRDLASDRNGLSPIHSNCAEFGKRGDVETRFQPAGVIGGEARHGGKGSPIRANPHSRGQKVVRSIMISQSARSRGDSTYNWHLVNDRTSSLQGKP